MSSILRALKKLESSKTALRPEDLKIDAEILRPDSRPRFSSTSLLAASLVLMACASGGTYLYMKRELGQTSSMAPSVQNTTVSTSPAPAVTKSATPPLVPPSSRQQRSAKPENRPDQKPALILRHQGEKGAAPPGREPVFRPVDKANAAKHLPAAETARSIPQLRVNGIAFEGSAADNMAIINGVAVAKGTVVAGATVTEILKDRVKFHYNGEPFEIMLGQSNR